jgi:hypothetical protein
LALTAVFLLLETIIFFFWECFATPVSFFIASGFNGLSFVDQSNR